MEEKEVTVLKVEPGKHPEVVTIGTKLEDLQNAVGGLIEFYTLEPNVDILCNEEGKLIGLEGNRKINNDIIAGTFYVVGSDDNGDIISISNETIEKYKQRFWDIETYTQEEVESSIFMEFFPMD